MQVEPSSGQKEMFDIVVCLSWSFVAFQKSVVVFLKWYVYVGIVSHFSGGHFRKSMVTYD